jgi:hypothetical protein
MSTLVRVGRYFIVAAALFIGAAPTKQPTASAEQVASRAPEVRLRKLHLVRPDLIPYPLYYEVVC